MEVFDDSAPEADGVVFVAEDLLPVWDGSPFVDELFPHVEVALSSLVWGGVMDA